MLGAQEDRLRDTAESFYRAFIAADRETLARVIAPQARLVIGGDTAISGMHAGPEGIGSLRLRLRDLTDGTWHPLRPDSFDIATSSAHAVIMDRFIAQRRDLRLDSHEAIILAAKEGRVMVLFHYLHHPAPFAAFWAA
ncbi:MAG TPA: hypothetical protein VE596_11030 [Gaiellaceae bacterium]|jgi:hypothetical protein|nr:hypothetical protein [Gaiellaceae bacterium]